MAEGQQYDRHDSRILPSPEIPTPGFLLVAWGVDQKLVPLKTCLEMKPATDINGRSFWRVKTSAGGTVNECYAAPSALAAAFGEAPQ